LYISGGTSYKSPTVYSPLNDLWEFDPIKKRWTEIIPDSGEADMQDSFGSALVSNNVLKSMFHPKMVADARNLYIFCDIHGDKDTQRSIVRYNVETGIIDELKLLGISEEVEKLLQQQQQHKPDPNEIVQITPKQVLIAQYAFEFCRVTAAMLPLSNKVALYGGFAFDGPCAPISHCVIAFDVIANFQQQQQ